MSRCKTPADGGLDVPTRRRSQRPSPRRDVVAWYRGLGTADNAVCDDPGRLPWVAMLDAGTLWEQVLEAMVRSTRYASLRVAGAYRSGLGRSLDRGALVDQRRALASTGPTTCTSTGTPSIS